MKTAALIFSLVLFASGVPCLHDVNAMETDAMTAHGDHTARMEMTANYGSPAPSSQLSKQGGDSCCITNTTDAIADRDPSPSNDFAVALVEQQSIKITCAAISAEILPPPNRQIPFHQRTTIQRE